MPKNVIIVEQNPIPNSISELDFLKEEVWPFQIEHVFTHKTGACQARNRALELVKSKWCFLNDDDNRFRSDLIEKAIGYLKKFKCKAILTFYPIKTESKSYFNISQTTIFGSGNSIVASEVLEKVKFKFST